MKKLTSLIITIVTICPLTTIGQSKLNGTNINAVVKALSLEEKASLLVGYTTGNSYFGLPSDTDPNSKDVIPRSSGHDQSN